MPFFSICRNLNVLRFMATTPKAFYTGAASGTLQITTSLLKECKYLIQAKLTHQKILVLGLAHCLTDLIGAYITCNAPAYATKLLERLEPLPYSLFWWNALMRRAIRSGLPNEVLVLHLQMHRLGWRPDHYTFPFVLKACGELSSFRLGASVHAVVCSSGFNGNVFVCNALVTMYGRCSALGNAQKMFDEVFNRGIGDVVSWNSIVSAYSQNGESKNALNMFGRMMKDLSARPNAFSLVNILPVCGSMGLSMWGKEVHGFAVRNGFNEDVYVGNAIVDMYSKCELMDEADKVFGQMKVRDVVSWNAMVTAYSHVGRFEDAIGLFEKMSNEKIELNVVTWSAVIAGFAQRGLGYEALNVFRQMLGCGIDPNVVTLVSLLSGCASAGALLQGKEAHCYAIKCVLNQDMKDQEEDLMIINGLIDMYAKCKGLKMARKMFDLIEPKEKNVVSWTVMIGGYAQHGEANDALLLFHQMLGQHNYQRPNAFTMSCALMACAHLGALRFGKEIHAYVIRNEHDSTTPFVSNCLIDMYCKSGDIGDAQVVFNKMKLKNFVSWTSLMAGYGMHGHGKEALQVFDDMRKVGMVPDGVTFVVLLYACSHSGLIDEGIRYFSDMTKDYGVTPTAEHYACMVDLLGRAGRLCEALKLISDMPMEPTPIVWFSLLSGCRIHGNVEVGEYAANRLSKLDLQNDGSYTLLSNMYANANRWKDVARIRYMMKHTGIKKRPGCSWVQGKEGTTTFFVGDRRHPRSQQIYELLASLIERIKAIGYVPETSFALHDVDDEEKGDLLFEHSEKLALAYAILTTPLGTPIRITKNIRVCGDCHNAMTYISKIIEHEIILRDSSRFHHFKNGSCSCKGYW
ncbi:pentatricopeptide repeat-containing protein At5g16860 [Cannabis sativa]|nr:pentatricopeptide repeat-containing protein At5g16860 [Cannabis sativa]XP_030504468.2 pentatricopeptide repeat-containing protein At5g16860 [Cannabis sativa]XP_030504469.2 pentatricopeptide repeat-containing protein At5g16860 [Cannabis sativa]